MNTFKNSLHIWITAASLAAFLTGWGFLAHASKPIVTQAVNNASSQTIVAISPIQAIDNLFQITPSRSNAVQASFSSPRLRTGGS